jgi:hypothetical protein
MLWVGSACAGTGDEVEKAARRFCAEACGIHER